MNTTMLRKKRSPYVWKKYSAFATSMIAANSTTPNWNAMKRVNCVALASPTSSPERVMRYICEGTEPAIMGVRLPKNTPEASTLMRSRTPSGES